MTRNKIYEQDTLYDILRPFVDANLRGSYSSIKVVGRENIPADGAIILAPNHCNTLMDALVILQSFKDETVFGARADMFNKKFIADIMFFLRILPMVRQRDGLRNVLKNIETGEIITETLENDVRFCVFPEGRHRPKHSLLPLGKGVSRMAMAADEAFGDKKKIYVVPVGIEYGDYFRFRGTALVNIGKPIDAGEFLRNCGIENEVQKGDAFRKVLAEEIKKYITYIADDENYDKKWALTKILTQAAEKGKSKKNLVKRLNSNRTAVELIERALEEQPCETEKVLEKADEFERKRRKKGISTFSFGYKKPVLRTIIKTALTIIGLPFFIVSAVASLLSWVSYYLITKGIKDKAFHNTVGFATKAIGTVVMTLIWTIVCFLTLKWFIALPIVIASIFSAGFFYDYLEYLRIYISDVKLLFNKKLRKSFDKILKEAMELF